MPADGAGPSADSEAPSPDPAVEAAFSRAADGVEAAALRGDARLSDQVGWLLVATVCSVPACYLGTTLTTRPACR